MAKQKARQFIVLPVDALDVEEIADIILENDHGTDSQYIILEDAAAEIVKHLQSKIIRHETTFSD